MILMLHGWTGDENSMWIFADRLPKRALLVAPRGRHTTLHGGFGWHEHKMRWPSVDDFRPAAQALMEWISPENFLGCDRKPLMLLGFSQGAALAFTLALLYPERVAAVAGLSGFLPEGVATLLEGVPLENKPVFLAHGSKDELVEVRRAHLAAQWLRQAGAQVDYCEDNVGHKLSASCFRSLQIFFQDIVR
jgi:phospholipase/carboxylesterase